MKETTATIIITTFLYKNIDNASLKKNISITCHKSTNLS